MKSKIGLMKSFLLIAVFMGMGIFTNAFATKQSQSLDQVYTVDKNNAFSSTSNTTEKAPNQQNLLNNTDINDNSLLGSSNKQQRIDAPGDPGNAPEDTPVGDGFYFLLVSILGYCIVRFNKYKLLTKGN